MYSKKIQKVKSTSGNTRREEIDAILESCEIYRNQLIQYCLQYFECEYEYAEDCVQDAYVALFENLNNGIEIKNYKAWLYTVVLNYKNKTIKDKLKRNEYDFKSNAEKDAALNNTSYGPDYLDDFITDEMIEEQALKIISSLNPDERKLYVSYYLKHKKLKDIANDLGVSPPTMRKRHTALKRKIKQKVKDFEKF